jgi:hypothetical protein
MQGIINCNNTMYVSQCPLLLNYKNYTSTYVFQDGGEVNIPFSGIRFTMTAISFLYLLTLVFSPLLVAFPTEKHRTQLSTLKQRYTKILWQDDNSHTWQTLSTAIIFTFHFFLTFWSLFIAICQYSSLLVILTYFHHSVHVFITPWEANRFAASQEIPRIVWNPKAPYRIPKRVHKCPPFQASAN